MARLFALSDLHVDAPGNGDMLDGLADRPDDVVVVAGDVADDAEAVVGALDRLRQRFGLVVWTPGNHELLTTHAERDPRTGVERYRDLVSWCTENGVVTPECPFPEWTWEGETLSIVPVFTMYDYSFRPGRISLERAMQIAGASGSVCSDTWLLCCDPFEGPAGWCDERVELTAARLATIPGDRRCVLVGHYPLRYELAQEHRLPLFSMWCGTRRTETWHKRFRAAAVVYGHLHRPGTALIDNVPFSNVSVGLARERKGRAPRLTQIIPDGLPLLVPMGG